MGKLILSSILSFIFPGLGQLYNKHKIKGILFVLLGILFVYINIFGFRLPLTLLRFIAAGEALISANKKLKSGESESFLRPKNSIVVLGLTGLLIFSVTFVPYRLLIKPSLNLFSQISHQKVSEEDMKQAEEKMLSYLEEKYGKEFEIKEKEYISELGRYQFTVTSTEQDFLFSGSYNDLRDTYEDYYMNGIWNKEFDAMVKPIAESKFENIWVYSSGVFVNEEVRNQLDPRNIPSYELLREQYPNEYEQKFQLYVFENIDEGNKEDKLDKVFEMVKKIRERSINSIQFRVYFYQEELLQKRGPDIKVSNDYREYQLYELTLTGKSIQKVESASDLTSYLKKSK